MALYSYTDWILKRFFVVHFYTDWLLLSNLPLSKESIMVKCMCVCGGGSSSGCVWKGVVGQNDKLNGK